VLAKPLLKEKTGTPCLDFFASQKRHVQEKKTLTHVLLTPRRIFFNPKSHVQLERMWRMPMQTDGHEPLRKP
jgi:hypothetical protein